MTQILFFYVIGLVFFIISLENDSTDIKQKYIYLGLSFFVNLMGYLSSYSDETYTSASYFPLILLMVSIILIVVQAFESVKLAFDEESDDYKNDSYESNN